MYKKVKKALIIFVLPLYPWYIFTFLWSWWVDDCNVLMIMLMYIIFMIIKCTLKHTSLMF